MPNEPVTAEGDNHTWQDSIRFQTKYTQSNPIARHLTNRFIKHIVGLVDQLTQPGDRVLDVGCGEGITLHHLEQSLTGLELAGIELDDQSLQVAQKLTTDVQLKQGSIYELPFPDASFDLVLCTEVLEHLENPAQGLAEVARIARRDVILSVPREPLWRMLNMARGAYWRDWGNTEGHLNHWSRSAFERFVQQSLKQTIDHSVLPWAILHARK